MESLEGDSINEGDLDVCDMTTRPPPPKLAITSVFAGATNETGGTEDKRLAILRVGDSRGTEENFGGKSTEMTSSKENRRIQ